jgi:tight adherence protein C
VGAFPLLLLAGVAAGGAVFLVVGELYRARLERAEALRRVRLYRRPVEEAPAEPRTLGLRPVVPAPLRRAFLRLTGRSEELLAARLLAAGLGGRLSAAGYVTLELVASALLGAGGLLAGLHGGRPVAVAVVLAAALAGAGLALPHALVNARRRRRVERIRIELPDALDLLAVSVSAGLGLDAAISKLAESMRGPLAEELAVVLTETRIGESRARALRRLADRLDTPEVTALVRALVQGEQLGVSLVDTLRTQAEEARRRRQVAAEERANKASVKMLFPTALLIFPALFIVILSPAIMSLKKGL